MNQCVPNWDVEENHPLPPPPPHAPTLRADSNYSSITPDVPTFDCGVAELTWENGQPAMHGLCTPRLVNGRTVAAAGSVKYAWEKQLPAGGTLESVVNQANAILPGRKSNVQQSGCRDGGDDEFVPWFEDHGRPTATESLGLGVDALVPCSNKSRNDREPCSQVPSIGTCGVGCSATHVGSCSGATPVDSRLPRFSAATATAGDQSVSGSATYGRDSRQVTVETCEREFVTPGFTSTSLASPENTSPAKQCSKNGDEHDSACHSRNERDAEEERKKGNGKSSHASTKRSRAAAVHNQSERKRRDKINQKMKTLQKLVPNSSKTDKASMLDEVIEYLKQLQAQVNIMSRMNLPSMMMPLALQQQLQMMSMMAAAPIGLGMNMGMGMGGVMDLNSIGRAPVAAAAGMPHVLHPAASAAFIPAASSWDGFAMGDRLQAAAAASSSPMAPDPFAAFLACPPQPMTSMEAYARMAALYQQFQQTPGAGASQNKLM